MKLRAGFVSNSSSASFIIQTDFEKDELLRTLYYEFDHCFFNKNDFIKQLDERIKNQKRLEEDEERESCFKNIFGSQLNEMIDQRNNFYSLKEEDIEFIEKVLEYYGVKLDENSFGTRISHYV